MPWEVVQKGDWWVVQNKNTKRVRGRHKTKAKANRQLAALHIHVPESEYKK